MQLNLGKRRDLYSLISSVLHQMLVLIIKNLDQKSRLMTEPISKYYQPQKYSFGRDNKLKKIKTETPGPGAY